VDYKKKLKSTRYRDSAKVGRCFNEEMESDRGRAINSAAVRRLQQKTQVFPLEVNAAVRSRLTHSLEVQQVGRYIAKTILKKLAEANGGLKELNLFNFEEGFVSATEVACLLHDIGNPPFGHFGEEAINLWCKETLATLFQPFENLAEHRDYFQDLLNFDGNAQGIRILHSLQALNLTYTQIACLMKYTRAAYVNKPNSYDPFRYRKKKPGYFLSEKELILKINEDLSIDEGCRFPLTYIMEAADDISYCIADLDDAIDKEILTIDKLHSEIINTWNSFGCENQDVIKDGYLLEISNHAYDKYKNANFNNKHAYFLTLRTRLVNDLVHYAAQRYVDNHEHIFNGEFDESLLDGEDKYHYATETLREVAVKNVFNNREVENLELKGYAVISGLLNVYTKLVTLKFDDFKKLVQTDRLKEFPIETRLYHKLPSKHKETFFQVVNPIYDQVELTLDDELKELYYRSRLIIDCISGMTDQYALDEYRNLTAK
jgi:dGTPase